MFPWGGLPSAQTFYYILVNPTLRQMYIVTELYLGQSDIELLAMVRCGKQIGLHSFLVVSHYKTQTVLTRTFLKGKKKTKSVQYKKT